MLLAPSLRIYNIRGGSGWMSFTDATPFPPLDHVMAGDAANYGHKERNEHRGNCFSHRKPPFLARGIRDGNKGARKRGNQPEPLKIKA